MAAVAYEFVYLKLAEQQPDFEPLPGFPSLHRRYESGRLFSVFANRQMPRGREVLARSEGMRATDRIEVLAAPTRTPEGDLTALFFARGVRHVDGAADAIASLAPGGELSLIAEPDNSVNPPAMLLNSRTSQPVGYAPDYLLDTIHDLIEFDSGSTRVTVEHVNEPASAPHMRLLCRLAAPWPPSSETRRNLRQPLTIRDRSDRCDLIG